MTLVDAFRKTASVIPTVRGRLSALVVVALVPALVIVAYDAWRARERAFAELANVSTRIVRLMQRELADRITRAAHRLNVLAADPDVVARSPLAARKLVDALRDDHLYNNLLIADGISGDVQASAVPLAKRVSAREAACISTRTAGARLCNGRVSTRAGDR